VIFTPAGLSGVYLVDLRRIEDDRGFFARGWCSREFADHGLNPKLEQINVGFSHHRGTVRGMHFQRPPFEEAKLVRCTRGAIYDVTIDLRHDSPTFRQWLAVELTADNRRMLYVPEGFAHGYQTLVDDTEMYYQTSAAYAPEAASGVRFDDPVFGVTWPLAVTRISQTDRSWPVFRADPESPGC
jgi:dTDP-4-dehydrorhamnose 3,5-epimerase